MAYRFDVHDVAVSLCKLTKGKDFRFGQLRKISTDKSLKILGFPVEYLRTKIFLLIEAGYLQKNILGVRTHQYEWLKDLTEDLIERETGISRDFDPEKYLAQFPVSTISFLRKLYSFFGTRESFFGSEVISEIDILNQFGLKNTSVLVYLSQAFDLNLLNGELVPVPGRGGKAPRLHFWTKELKRCFGSCDKNDEVTERPFIFRDNGSSFLRLTVEENDLFLLIGTIEKVGAKNDRFTEKSLHNDDEDMLTDFFEKMVKADILDVRGVGAFGRILIFSQVNYAFWKDHVELISSMETLKDTLEAKLIALQRKTVARRKSRDSGARKLAEATREAKRLQDLKDEICSKFDQAVALRDGLSESYRAEHGMYDNALLGMEYKVVQLQRQVATL